MLSAWQIPIFYGKQVHFDNKTWMPCRGRCKLLALNSNFLWAETKIASSRKMKSEGIGKEQKSNASVQFSSVQFSHSVVSDSLRPHESKPIRPPCPSPTPGVHSDSRPSSQWCHPAISSSVIHSPPAPNPSQHQSLFQWVNSLHEVPKVLEFQL